MTDDLVLSRADYEFVLNELRAEASALAKAPNCPTPRATVIVVDLRSRNRQRYTTRDYLTAHPWAPHDTFDRRHLVDGSDFFVGIVDDANTNITTVKKFLASERTGADA